MMFFPCIADIVVQEAVMLQINLEASEEEDNEEEEETENEEGEEKTCRCPNHNRQKEGDSTMLWQFTS